MQKTMIMLMTITALFTNAVLAQTPAPAQEKSVTDLKAELAAIQTRLKASEAAELANQGRFSSKLVGIGREMGEAMNGFVEALDGGMKVTTERVNEFAQTDVGKFAMIGIGWKIFASDILGVVKNTISTILGLMLLGMFMVVLNKALHIFYIGKMIVVKKEGPWYNRHVTKERSEPLYKKMSNLTSEQNNAMATTANVLILTLAILLVGGLILI